MRIPTSTCCLALFLAALSPDLIAQDRAPEPRRFVPRDYVGECFIDLKGMRESGLWDGLERSVLLRPMFEMLREDLGFGVEDIDTVRVFFAPGGGEEIDPWDHPVTIVEGAEAVGIPSDAEGEEVEIGGHTCLHVKYPWDEGGGQIYYTPAPGTLVVGPPAHVEPTLKGEHTGGVPHPDLLPFMGDEGVYFRMVAAVREGDDLADDLPEEGYAPGDRPELVVLRLVEEEGEEGATMVVIEGASQFERGDESPAVAAAYVRKKLREADEHPRLGALKWLWRQVEVIEDGPATRVRFEFGTVREASARLPMLLLPNVLMFSAAARAPEPVPVQELPEKPKKEKDKEKGKGR